MNDLSGINRKRRQEIAANEKLIKKLEQQLEVLQKECDAAKTKRDQAQLNAKQHDTGGEAAIHPLLQSLASSGKKVSSEATGDVVEECAQTEAASLSDWLKTIPSPYD